MANIKIANLPTATEIIGTDLLIIDQSESTSSISINKFKTLANIKNNNNYLSSYGSDLSSVKSFFDYAKSSNELCFFDTDVELTSELVLDAEQLTIKIEFLADIKSDSQFLVFKNLGEGSILVGLSFKNITTPYVISRWDESGNWINDSQAILASLKQTNEEIGYQPTASDSDVWSLLSTEVKNQKICSGIIIESSLGVDIVNPKGRYGALTINDSNRCRVITPSIMGGKHQYGTILFNNTFSTAWGYGNVVIGGEVRYGSVSGVTFMRHRGNTSGVRSGFKPYRCGESGVKTYQNEVNSISARCYQMEFDSITPFQCYYDGIDVFSDYGSYSSDYDRVEDYSLSLYPWNQLPTNHTVTNITSKDCHGTGMTSDGQFNVYKNIIIEETYSSGFFNNGANNYLSNILVKNANKNNAALGAQIRMLGISTISSAVIITDSSIVNSGYALYTTGAGTSLKDINLDNTLLSSQPKNPSSQNMYLGRISSSDTSCSLIANPRPTVLANPCGKIQFDLTYSLSGSERGNISLLPVYGGTYVNGIRARSENGGFFIGGLANASDSTYLNNGEFQLYEKLGSIYILAKKADGTVINKFLTS